MAVRMGDPALIRLLMEVFGDENNDCDDIIRIDICNEKGETAQSICE